MFSDTTEYPLEFSPIHEAILLRPWRFRLDHRAPAHIVQALQTFLIVLFQVFFSDRFGSPRRDFDPAEASLDDDLSRRLSSSPLL